MVVAGGMRIDYLITATGEVQLGRLGGNALYAAVGASHWVDGIAIVARVGENYPQHLLDRLATLGFDTRGIRRVRGEHDHRTFYAYLDERTRVDTEPERHFARWGLALPPELEGYTDSHIDHTRPEANPITMRVEDIAPFAGANAVAHIAPIALLSQDEMTATLARGGARQVTLDPGEYKLDAAGRERFRALCGRVDALLPSELEVELLLGDVAPHEAAEQLARWGPPVVVIKRGPEGSLVYERDAERFTHVPAYPVQVVDVTGAGDSYAGAFAAGLAATGDPRRAARMGAVAASLAIEGYGALHALGSASEVVRRRLDEMEAGGI